MIAWRAKDGSGNRERIFLWESYAQIPDPRNDSGKRHPLQAILTLTSVAILSGARSLYAVAQFGRDRGAAFARELGFTRDAGAQAGRGGTSDRRQH